MCGPFGPSILAHRLLVKLTRYGSWAQMDAITGLYIPRLRTHTNLQGRQGEFICVAPHCCQQAGPSRSSLEQ